MNDPNDTREAFNERLYGALADLKLESSLLINPPSMKDKLMSVDPHDMVPGYNHRFTMQDWINCKIPEAVHLAAGMPAHYRGSSFFGCRHLRPAWLSECIKCSNARRERVYGPRRAA